MTLGSVHVFCPFGRNGIPLDMLLILGRRLSHYPKTIERAKACSSQQYEVNVSGKLALNISVCGREIFLKLPCKI